MDAPVVASVIASTTSLVVAVVGLIANGRGQRKAAQEAHENALALFDRQAAAQAKSREEESNERLRLAHLDERRSIYARLPASIIKHMRLRETAEDASQAAEAHESIESSDGRRHIDKQIQLLQTSIQARNEVAAHIVEMWTLAEEIRLLGSDRLAKAAASWVESVFEDRPDPEQNERRRDFMQAAREDLGLEQADREAAQRVTG